MNLKPSAVPVPSPRHRQVDRTLIRQYSKYT